MAIKYYLYSSEGCHLCEQALELFKKVAEQKVLSVVDIVDNELNETNLVELYGVHIPVLERISDHEKLFWPFNEAQLKVFIQKC